MSQPNNPDEQDWRNPASRPPHRVSLGPTPPDTERPIRETSPASYFPPGSTTPRVKLPDFPPDTESPQVTRSDVDSRSKLASFSKPEKSEPQTEQPTAFKMPAPVRPGIPKVELKRLEVEEPPPAPSKSRSALPSPSELFDEPGRATAARGWPPPRLNINEAPDAPASPQLPPSVTGFASSSRDDKRGSSWEGPLNALERMRASGEESSWPPPAASSWPPPAAAVPQTQIAPPPPQPPKPPSAPRPRKNERSKIQIAGTILAVGAVFSAIVFWPTKNKPESAASPQVKATAEAPVPKATPTTEPSPIAVARPVETPQARETPRETRQPEPTPEPAIETKYSVSIAIQPQDAAAKIALHGDHSYKAQGAGKTEIPQVEQGSYSLEIHAPGYKPYKQKVEIGADQTLKVTLQKSAATAPKPTATPKPQPTHSAAPTHTAPPQPAQAHTAPPPPAQVHTAPPPRPYTPPPARPAPPRPAAPPARHELPVNL